MGGLKGVESENRAGNRIHRKAEKAEVGLQGEYKQEGAWVVREG